MVETKAIWEFCNGCKHQIVELKVDRIKKKCKLTNNNFIYKNWLSDKMHEEKRKMKWKALLLLCFIILSLTGCQGLSPIPHPTKDETVEKFPQSLYPPAEKFPDQQGFQGTTGCPNLQDVEVPDPKSTEELFSIISEFGKTREGDLELSDRAFWPVVEGDWEGRKQRESQEDQPLTQRVSIEQIVSMPATESPYADLISNNCGSKTLELSWCVAVLPQGASKIEDAPSLTSYYYLIKRSGNWLIWSNPH